MATLTSTKIKNTYDALLKSIDNDAIGTTAKQITDGLGNVTPLYISTTQVGIGVTPEAGLNLHVFGDAKIGSNLTVIGNLVVEGSTTTVGTDTLTVKDPLIVLANNNTSTDAVDIGFYGKYTPSGTTLYSGLFREALTGKYRLFKGLEDEPTTTVNTSGTGYAVATLVSNLEGNVTGNITGNITGNVTGGTISGTTGTFSGDVDIDGTLDVDDVISVEGSAFGRIEIGGASGGYVDLKAPNSDDYDLRLITSVGGAELLSIDTLKFYTGATTDLAFTIDASQNATFENNVTIPETPTADTHAASKGYVDAAVEGQDTLAEILANGNTSGANDIIMADDQRINFGTSNALNLRWSTTAASGQGASIIDSNRIFIETNFFQLNSRTGESMIRATGNSDVELYYDNSKKLETTSTGVTVTGNINIGDNNKILLGDSDDVEMYFDGATQFGIINDTAGGSIFLRSDSFLFRNDTDQFYSLSSTTHTFKSSGTTRLTVNSAGIDVNGNINVSSDLTVDTDTLFVDASEDSVGIGLTNPADYSADELVISVPDDSGMTLVSGTTDTAYITFADGTAAADQANFISHDHNTNTLTVFSQAKVSIGILEAEVAYFTDTAFYVDKSTTIDDTLTVNGNSTFAGDVTVNNSGDGKITIGGTSGLEIIHNNAGNTIAEIKQLYASTSNSAQMKLTSGFTTFHTGTSGTERMRIDSSGVVQVRNTEPTIQLYNTDTSLVANQLIGTVDFYKSDGSGAGAGVSASIQVRSDSSIGAKSYMAFHTDNGTGSQNAERMRIDSSGSLIVGTATVAAANAAADNFVIKGGGTAVGLTISQDSNSGTGTIFFGDVASSSAAGFRYNHNTGDMAVSFEDDITFSNNGGERMRITSGGDIQVTGGSFYNSVSGITIIGNSDEFEFVDSLASGTKRFRPGVDNSFDLGDSSRRWDDVWATNPAIQTSDRNEKNTIKETDLGLDFINKLKPVSYIWNNKTRTHYGLIAQDVQEVLKDISKDTKDFAGFIKADVSEEKDNTKHSYGLRYNEFISPMIKAIQELKAEIETLKAQINN